MKVKIPSPYVKVNENIKDGDIVRLKNEGEYNEIEGQDGKKQVLQFELELPDGDVKTYSMNVTTQKNMVQEYGDDTVNWIDKDLRANVAKQLSFGKMTNVLILTPKHWDGTSVEDSKEAPEVSVEDQDGLDEEIPPPPEEF